MLQGRAGELHCYGRSSTAHTRQMRILPPRLLLDFPIRERSFLDLLAVALAYEGHLVRELNMHFLIDCPVVRGLSRT